jgi:hypothetical protein
MPVLATDERYITMFARTLHNDDKAYGFAFNPKHATATLNPVTFGKLGLDYYFVTISDGSSTAAGSLRDALSVGNRWIILETSVTLNNSSQITFPVNTVLDARGQRLVVTGKGFDIQTLRPVIANTYVRTVTGSSQRGFDVRGGAQTGFFPNNRVNGDIADQGWNFGGIGVNGLNISMPHNWFMQTTGGGFNAGANFGSSGEGSASNADNNDLMYANLHHLYSNTGLRIPKMVGGYLHVMCPYARYSNSDGIGVRSDVQGHVGYLWCDHPTIHATSLSTTHQNQGIYNQSGDGHSHIPNWTTATQTGEVRKLGTTGTVTLINGSDVPDPATFYDYDRHYATKSADFAAHDTFIINRGGDREQATVGGSLIGASDYVGRTLDITFGDQIVVDTLTAGEKTQLIDEELIFPAGGSFVAARDFFDEDDISQPTGQTIRLTVSKTPSLATSISDGYYQGGSGYLSGDSDFVGVPIMGWNRIIINASGSGGGVIHDPPPAIFNYRWRFPVLHGLGL